METNENKINFPVTVKESCSNIRSIKEITLSEGFVGNCQNSYLKTVNNYGARIHTWYICHRM